MTGRKPSLIARLTRLGGAAAQVAALRGPGTIITAPNAAKGPDFRQRMKSARPEIVTYGLGYTLALLLTIVAFALVHWHWASPSTALWIVLGLALIQIVVHFRCFLHVTLRGPARDDLLLILFSTAIVLLMVGGTLVILFNLRMRMM